MPVAHLDGTELFYAPFSPPYSWSSLSVRGCLEGCYVRETRAAPVSPYSQHVEDHNIPYRKSDHAPRKRRN